MRSGWAEVSASASAVSEAGSTGSAACGAVSATSGRRVFTPARGSISRNHRGRLIDGGKLHALHFLLQNGPAAIADARNQGDQNGQRPDGARFDPGQHAFGAGNEGRVRIGERVAEVLHAALGGDDGRRGGRTHPVGDGEIRLDTEFAEGPIRVHAQIAGVGPDIARDEALRFEGRDVGVFDGGDIGGLDLQFALDVQQGLAQRGAFAPASRSPRRSSKSSNPLGLSTSAVEGFDLQPIMHPALHCPTRSPSRFRCDSSSVVLKIT